MAIITRSSNAGLDANNGEFVLKGVSGSAIAAVSPCFMAADGKIYAAAVTSGSGADGRAKYQGFNPIAAAEGDVVSLYRGIFEYASAMTPGTPLYITSGSAGYLETVAPTVSYDSGSALVPLADPVAYAIDAQRIVVIR
jgi:hypothetical protein